VYLKVRQGLLLSFVVCAWSGGAFAQVPATVASQTPPPAQAASQTPSPTPGNNTIPFGISNSSSWKFEQVGDHLHLIGQAAIEGTNLKFFADDIDLYMNTNRVVASGNVVFTNEDGRISAERVEFNTETGTGTFYDASGIMSLATKPGAAPRPGAPVISPASSAAFGGQDPDVYFYGEKLEKLAPRRYRITRGGFTTCVQPTPRWEVTSDSLILNLDEYAIARNMLLKVKGVPMFYLPVLYYPIQQTQRQTGFLLPTYGRSTIRGQALSEAFFWAIDRSQDATLYGDWFTKTGVGEGAEYRFVAGPLSAGSVRFYHFGQHEATYVTNGTTTTLAPSSSYSFNGVATEAYGKLRLRGRLDYFSNVQTQQLYQQNLYLASLRSRLIEGGASDNFGPVALTALYQRNETFNSNTNSILYGSTPKVDAILAPRQLFGAPMYVSLNSEYGLLPYQTINDGIITQDNGLSRVDFAPSLRVPLSKLTYLSINNSIGYRSTYYSRSIDPTTGKEVASPFLRNYTQLRSEIVGPVFTKIWDTPDTSYAERMKHVIEPAFTIDYTSLIPDYQRTPLLTDSSDFIVGGTERLTYGLTNRLMYRGKTNNGVRGQTREFVTVGVQQTYYSNVQSSRYDTSYASSATNGTPTNFSAVALTGRFSPSAKIDTNTRIEYNPNHLGLEVWTVGSTLSLGRSSGSLNFSRRHLTPGSPIDSYLSGSTSVHSANGHLTGTYALSWDLTHSTIVTQNVQATYMAQCCGLQAEVQKYNYFVGSGIPVPSDTRFNFSFVLAGLGTFSNFFGAFGGNTLR